MYTIVDITMKHQKIINFLKELTKNNIAYIKLIAPTNDSEYIKQSLIKKVHFGYTLLAMQCVIDSSR